MNRDPTPANDDAFFEPLEPQLTQKKWGQRKIWFIGIGLLFLAIFGHLARQPIANFVEFQMLTPEEKDVFLRVCTITAIGIETQSGKTVVETEHRGSWRGSWHLHILSLDNQRVDQTIRDAYWIKSIGEVVDVNARRDNFRLLYKSPYFVQFSRTPSEKEIVVALQPFLPQLESLRKEISNFGNEK